MPSQQGGGPYLVRTYVQGTAQWNNSRMIKSVKAKMANDWPKLLDASLLHSSPVSAGCIGV